MMKLKKTVRKLFLLAAVSAVLISSGCKHKQDSGEKFDLKFGIIKDGSGKENGTLTAIADGKVVYSGAQITKGTEVRLIGTPKKNRWTSWKGIPKPEDPYIAKFIMEKPVNVQVEFKLPILPGETITVFTINDVGVGGGESFDNEFLEHLDDGTNPLYVFDGGKSPAEAAFKIGAASYGAPSAEANPISKVIFTIDNGTPIELPVDERDVGQGFSMYLYEHAVTIPDKNEYPVQIEIYPNDKESFSEIVCNFRIKNSEDKPKIPGIGFLINNEIILKNGYKPDKPFEEESVSLTMQTTEDVISKVEIISGGASREIPIKHFEGWAGKIYEASGRVLLEDGVYKKYTVKAYPKDENKYSPAEMVFELAGTKMSTDNAEFVTVDSGSGPSAMVSYDVTYYDNKKHQYLDCYGQVKVDITAVTRSPRAKVKYLLTDFDGNMLTMPGDSAPQEKEMTSDGICSHSASITLYGDKPSILKTYVIAEDGVTKNDETGVRIEVFNKIDFKWDKEEKSNGENFSTAAYDEIKISQADFNALPDTGGKKYIYAVFKVIKEGAAPGVDAYTIKADGYPAYQEPYKKLNEVDSFWVWYKTKIDVTSLTSSSPLEIILPILENNNPCFTYKAKVKITP